MVRIQKNKYLNTKIVYSKVRLQVNKKTQLILPNILNLIRKFFYKLLSALFEQMNNKVLKSLQLQLTAQGYEKTFAFFFFIFI
jgi:hypothetical protein